MEYFTSPQDPESGSTACATTKDILILEAERPQKSPKSTSDLIPFIKSELLDLGLSLFFVNEKQRGGKKGLLTSTD